MTEMTDQEYTDYLADEVVAGKMKFASAVHSLMNHYDAWFMSARASCANDILESMKRFDADYPVPSEL